MVVALMSFLDTLDYSIDTLEPVSIFKCFGSSSISNEIVEEPCFTRTETVGFSTAFLGTSRWRELSSLSPLIPFPDHLPVHCLPSPSRNKTHRRTNVEDSNFRSGISSLASFAFALFLTVWGILVQSALVLRIRNT
jgi:hypothetical protein